MIRRAQQRRGGTRVDRSFALWASSRILRAFLEVRCTGTFPATVVMASTSNSSGEASAVRKATASSGEGSVSMMMGRGMRAWLTLLITANHGGLAEPVVAGMLFEQIEQHGARFIAIALQAVNARQIQVRLIEGRGHPDAFLKLSYSVIPAARSQIEDSKIIQRLRIIGAKCQAFFKYW